MNSYDYFSALFGKFFCFCLFESDFLCLNCYVNYIFLYLTVTPITEITKLSFVYISEIYTEKYFCKKK